MGEVLFRSDRLRFRKWCEEDKIEFRALNADPQVMEYFPKVLTSEESDELYKKIQEQYDKYGYTFYAVDRIDLPEPQFIGMIGMANPYFQLSYGADWIEIGWRTVPSSWGIGLASEGAKRAIEFAYEELGISTIYSFTAVINKRSERVMQKIGMEHVDYFNHPKLEADHPLLRHTLYRIDRKAS